MQQVSQIKMHVPVRSLARINTNATVGPDKTYDWWKPEIHWMEASQ